MIMQLLNWKTFVIVGALAIGGAFVYAQYAAEVANEGVVLTEKVKGNPEAAVVLTEYSDFQCPACAQFVPYVAQVVEDYGDRLKFEYKHFPLVNIHSYAVPAAKAAEAAGQQGKFWEMHDKLFEGQATWSKSSNPKAYFDQYAEELGLDMSLFRQHYRASLIAGHIEDQFDEALALGFTGTPSFLLNGEKMQFETFAEFIEQIEAAVQVDVSEVAAEISSL